MIKNILLKYNFTVQITNSINYAQCFKKYILINKRRTLIMINLKITKNFVLQKLIDKYNLKTLFKKILVNLIMINRNSLQNNDK